MTHTYNISGMTCNGCVAKAKSALLQIGDVENADVQLTAPQAVIRMQKHIPISTLQTALHKAGHYEITEADAGMHGSSVHEEKQNWWATFKPVLLISIYLILVTGVVVFYSGAGSDWSLAMRVFMSGFFVTFSFFKMLDLNGFTDSYSTYDIIAKRVRSWAYVYAFLELGLGLSYAANLAPLLTNLVALFVMTISIIGVLQSVWNKRSIQCACLGAVFNLPMSTITIIEDGLMILMSAVMVISLL